MDEEPLLISLEKNTMRKKVDKEGVEKKEMRKSTGKKDIADKHKEPMITFP